MKPFLLVNDPKSTPASFTRFVLPFGYQLERCEGVSSSSFYREAQSTDWLHSGNVTGEAALSTQERREYLTPEIARNLFSRARWFVMEGKDEHLKVALTSGIIDIYVRPAGIVLMEWEREYSKHNPSSAKVTAEDKEQASLLASGFLILETWFPDGSQPTLDDLLLWNELARYFRSPWAGHKGVNAKVLSAPSVYKSIDYLQRWSALLEVPVKGPDGYFLRLVPKKWLEKTQAIVHGGQLGEDASKHWLVHADNRCHVWTCAMHKDESLKKVSHDIAAAKEEAPGDSVPWLRLLNVDKPASDNANENEKLTPFEQRWLMERTYTRWASNKDPAIYGFTPHSGALMACSNSADVPTWQHFRSLYFDQLLLVLFVRTSLFRFSERLSVLASKAGETLALPEGSTERKAGFRELAKVFRDLRWEFAQFTNLYQFPIISHQQQALEMYALLRRQMVVEEFFQNVRTEIETTQTLLADAVAERQAQATLKLTALAFLGFLLSVAVGAMGSDALVNGLQRFFNEGSKLALGEVLLGGLLASFVLLVLLHTLFRLPMMQRLVKKTLDLDLDP